MKHIALFSVLFLALNSFAAEAPKAEAPNLEDELKQLSLPDNVAPAGISKEAFYAVQNRYSDLRNRFEIEMGGAHNFRGSSYLSANQIKTFFATTNHGGHKIRMQGSDLEFFSPVLGEVWVQFDCDGTPNPNEF